VNASSALDILTTRQRVPILTNAPTKIASAKHPTESAQITKEVMSANAQTDLKKTQLQQILFIAWIKMSAVDRGITPDNVAN
jgi:hypothetical protein